MFPANSEQIDAAKEVVKKLQFSYSPESFENPVLQKHWRNIEALALDRDAPEEMKDYTCKLGHCYINPLFSKTWGAAFFFFILDVLKFFMDCSYDLATFCKHPKTFDKAWQTESDVFKYLRVFGVLLFKIYIKI